jgi:hypothetical protein
LEEMFTFEPYEYFFKDPDGNIYDDVEEFKQFLSSHMAGGASKNCAIVSARLSEFEDRYLASEVEVEETEDLRCAVLRLKEGTIECVCPIHHHPLCCPVPPLIISNRYMNVAKTFSSSKHCTKAARGLVACAISVALAPISRPLHVSQYAGNAPGSAPLVVLDTLTLFVVVFGLLV